MEYIDKCPYCGSENFEFMGDNDYWNGKPFHCHECDNWFSEEDNEREDTRHKISALLEGTSEENPKKISFIIPSAEEDAVGLSTLEMPTVESIFELEGDGTIWFHICGENANGEPVWRDIDDLSITDMKGLLSCLLEQ